MLTPVETWLDAYQRHLRARDYRAALALLRLPLNGTEALSPTAPPLDCGDAVAVGPSPTCARNETRDEPLQTPHHLKGEEP